MQSLIDFKTITWQQVVITTVFLLFAFVAHFLFGAEFGLIFSVIATVVAFMTGRTPIPVELQEEEIPTNPGNASITPTIPPRRGNIETTFSKKMR